MNYLYILTLFLITYPKQVLLANQWVNLINCPEDTIRVDVNNKGFLQIVLGNNLPLKTLFNFSDIKNVNNEIILNFSKNHHHGFFTSDIISHSHLEFKVEMSGAYRRYTPGSSTHYSHARKLIGTELVNYNVSVKTRKPGQTHWNINQFLTNKCIADFNKLDQLKEKSCNKLLF